MVLRHSHPYYQVGLCEMRPSRRLDFMQRLQLTYLIIPASASWIATGGSLVEKPLPAPSRDFFHGQKGERVH